MARTKYTASTSKGVKRRKPLDLRVSKKRAYPICRKTKEQTLEGAERRRMWEENIPTITDNTSYEQGKNK